MLTDSNGISRSSAFRMAVGAEVTKILSGPKNVHELEWDCVAITNAIRTYFDTATKEYKIQITAEKRNLRRSSKRKDRRKMRMKRVSQYDA